jgi:ribosome maturation factor RimP
LTKNPFIRKNIFEYDEKSKYTNLLENSHTNKKINNENKINLQKINAVNEAFEDLLKTNNKIPMPSTLEVSICF